jgi:hypothetical protein
MVRLVVLASGSGRKGAPGKEKIFITLRETKHLVRRMGNSAQ